MIKRLLDAPRAQCAAEAADDMVELEGMAQERPPGPRFHRVETGGYHVLKKESGDDRITRVGTLLRRYSLGSFGPGAQARLLVAPGMTDCGRSGRSDLPWEERIHLDLLRRELVDVVGFSLLRRTMRVLVHSSGAY